MTRAARARNPLPWLAALLGLYLLAPIGAFFVRLSRGVSAAPGLGDALVTSLLTASISAAVIAALGIPLAYLLARARSRLAETLQVLVALPLALPPLMSGILLLYLVGPYTALGRLSGASLTDTRIGIVLAQTFVAAPFLVIAARGAFASLDPDLEEVARTLGHGRLACFLRVSLPAAWPGVQAGLLLAWLRSFGEFGATVILAYHPYTLPVFTFVQFDASGLPATMLPVAAALASAVLVLVLVQVRPGRGRRRSQRPEPAPPVPRAPAPLRFALHDVLGGFALDVELAGGSSRLALLGPSGSGKTLTLRLIAGTAGGARGRVLAGGRELAGLPPELRGVGYLPQRSALMPRRSVWQQVTFAPDADPRVASWWVEKLGLAGLEDRWPEELSGGQRRRVALARALARDPAVVLLDEPFSALDAPVRARLARELRTLQRDAGLTSVIVTHDPDEAALLADEVLVIEEGRILQQGPAADVLSRPASPRVAALLGVANTFTGAVSEPGRVQGEGLELAADTGVIAPGSSVLWAVSPRLIALAPAGEAAEDGRTRNLLEGIVLDSVSFGHEQELSVEVGAARLTVRSSGRPLPPEGEPVRLSIPRDAVRVWRPEPPSGR